MKIPKRKQILLLKVGDRTSARSGCDCIVQVVSVNKENSHVAKMILLAVSNVRNELPTRRKPYNLHWSWLNENTLSDLRYIDIRKVQAEVIPIKDLPLYIDWKTTKYFLEVLKTA